MQIYMTTIFNLICDFWLNAYWCLLMLKWHLLTLKITLSIFQLKCKAASPAANCIQLALNFFLLTSFLQVFYFMILHLENCRLLIVHIKKLSIWQFLTYHSKKNLYYQYLIYSLSEKSKTFFLFCLKYYTKEIHKKIDFLVLDYQ